MARACRGQDRGRGIRVEGHLSDFAHLRPCRTPWVIARSLSGKLARSMETKLVHWRHTISDLDLGAGVTLCHISDAAHNLGHDGRLGASNEAGTLV